MNPFRSESSLRLASRRDLIQGAAALTVASFLPGCSSSGSTSSSPGTPVVSNPQPNPGTPLVSGTVTITTTTAGTIGSQFIGLSYEKNTLHTQLWATTSGTTVTPNAALVYLFKLLGVTILRVGGNTVDENTWTPNGAGLTATQIAPLDVNALAAFVKAVGCQCLYGVNLGGSAPGAVYPTTTALAAAEVAYVAAAFATAGASSLFGIEIGNECDDYGGSYYASGWSLAQFETLWNQYRTAILAVTPSVTVTGPASGGSVSTWTVPFGQTEGSSKIALLTQHYYRGNGQSASSTAADLITPDASLINNLSILQTAAKQIGVPFRLSECNSFYNGGSSGVSDSYASSLWVIDFLFDNALGGSSGVNFHGGGNSGGYTPIADTAGTTSNTIVGPRPEYYGILFMGLAGQGTLLQTTVSAGALNVTAYTVRSASGGLAVVIVNKDPTNNLQMAVTLPQSVTSANLYTLTQATAGVTGPTLTATTGVSIQNTQIAASGSTFGYTPGAPYTVTPIGTSVTCYVPALSAVLIQLA